MDEHKPTIQELFESRFDQIEHFKREATAYLALKGCRRSQRESMELFVGAIKAGASPSRLLTSAAISAFDNVLRTGKVPSKNRRGGASYGADGKQRQIAKSFHLHRLNGDEKPAITTAIEWRCDVNYVYKVAKQHAPYAEMDALFSLAKNDTSKVYEVAKLLDGLLAEVADEFLDYIAQSTN